MSLNRLVNNHSLTANDGGEAISINSFKTNTMKKVKDGSRDGSLTHSKTVVIDGTAIQNDNYC